LAVPNEDLSATFGVDAKVASKLLGQLVNVLQPDPSRPVDAEVLETALGIIRAIGPTDTIEAMTATLMIAAQMAAMDAFRRSAHPEQTPAGRQMYASLGVKLANTHARLVDSINQGRGKGVTQRVIVERVNVEAGAQAVVGALASRD
jgi:hypothetical protein